jgi:hypothetical protein
VAARLRGGCTGIGPSNILPGGHDEADEGLNGKSEAGDDDPSGHADWYRRTGARAMSEYQYYEFMAVDRSLDEQQLREVRALSTRARITPRSFVNTYEWGDFRGDPSRLMETYFDAFLLPRQLEHAPADDQVAQATPGHPDRSALLCRGIGVRICGR